MKCWHPAQVDLVDADGLAECSRLIRGINSEAMLLQTEHSSAGVASLLNQGIYSQDTAVANSKLSKWSAPVSSVSQWEADSHASDSGQSASGPASRKKDVLHSSGSASKSAQHVGAAEEHPEEHRHSSRVSTMAIRPSSPLQLSRWGLCMMYTRNDCQ
jgi:G3E family GTPase